MQDYSLYHFSRKELIRYSLQGVLMISILGYLFYQSLISVLVLSPLIYISFLYKRRSLIKERRWKLNLEFKDGIQALAAALEAGYSAEHALEEARRDLGHIYSEKAMLMKEFDYILHQIYINIPVEKALEDFGLRSGVEDILSFSEVFGTAKRSGGDLVSIIKQSSDIIGDKIEVKREIITMISAKRLEANIMKYIPLFILLYLLLSSPDFLSPLYHNAFGIILMTLFLLVYLATFVVIDKIIEIEI